MSATDFIKVPYTSSYISAQEAKLLLRTILAGSAQCNSDMALDTSFKVFEAQGSHTIHYAGGLALLYSECLFRTFTAFFSVLFIFPHSDIKSIL